MLREQKMVVALSTPSVVWVGARLPLDIDLLCKLLVSGSLSRSEMEVLILSDLVFRERPV